MHGAPSPVGLVEQDPARCRERVVPGGRQVVGDLLDARLVGDGGPRVLLRPRALGRILAVAAVHLVQPLGLGVEGLEVVVAERPRRRDAVGVLDLAEVLRAQPVERGAVQLGGPADEVVDLRLERGAVGVVPGVGRDVPAFQEHLLGLPVLGLARQEVAPFEQQDPLAGRREGVGQGAPTGPGPDDDDVVVVGHRALLDSSAADMTDRRRVLAGASSSRWGEALPVRSPAQQLVDMHFKGVMGALPTRSTE